MQTAISAIFVFLLVILIHELGHFAVAKFVGIKVNEFAIGMGPKVLQTQKGDTKYTLRILPIGGYVNMEGEDENSNDPRGFNNASPLARIAVIAAGAIMNFVLAIIVLSIISYNIGQPTLTVDKISANSPAENSGVLVGDKILEVENVKILKWEDLSRVLNSPNTSGPLDVKVLRENKEKILSIEPMLEDSRMIIGIYPKYETSIIIGIKGGFKNTAYFLSVMFDFIKMVFKGQVTTNDLSGPIGVINEVGQAAKMGLNNLLLVLGFISVNLGFFNLLPIPALDGSKILFLLLEIIRGKPIDSEKENIIHLIGFALLIALMLVVTYKDLSKMNILKR